MFVASPPSTMPSAVVLGSPLVAQVLAGPADPAHCTLRVVSPASPVVGSALQFEMSLADAYGNPITADAYSNPSLAALYNNTVKVVMNGACRYAVAVAA
jgi:hypothetical protein